MGLVVLPKSLTAKTEAKAADVMADLNAIVTQVNGKLDLENFAESLRNSLIPAGTILATGRGAAPTGFLMCDGSAVSRTTYAVLFAAIGTTYGAGDGTTTFNLPDFRGRALVGVDGAAGRLSVNDALGQSGGHEQLQAHSHGNGTLATSIENVTHSHNIDILALTRHEGTGLAWTAMGSTPGSGFTNTSTESAFHTHAVTGAIASEGTGNGLNMPPYQVVNFMVKI